METLQNEEKKPLVHSEAWPSQEQQAVHSKVHELLNRAGETIEKSKIQYRLLEQSDIPEVKKLHLEWFPLRYGDDYFASIGKYQHTIAVGAFYKSKAYKGKKILLGAILARVQYDDSVSDIIHNRGICYRLLRAFNCWHVPDIILYIMTIGVVDEARRMGIGSDLIEQSVNVARGRFPTCKGVSLHVIEYNKSAISFYRKKGYKELQKIERYYNIGDKEYSAYHFGMLFGGISKKY